MIDTTGWSYYLKQDPIDKIRCASNLLYTPLVNPAGTIMCMHYDENSEYQKENTRLTKELVDFFFARELHHIKLFQQYSWAAKILEIIQMILNRNIIVKLYLYHQLMLGIVHKF